MIRRPTIGRLTGEHHQQANQSGHKFPLAPGRPLLFAGMLAGRGGRQPGGALIISMELGGGAIGR
jgi:hypothetical protein